jgi:hypothetical protein
MEQPRFAPCFAGWNGPWNFADAETTALRLKKAGFVDVRTNVEYAPVRQPDAAAYREFVTNVVCRHHLSRLPDQTLKDAFMDAVTELASRDDPPFELDYWRLNIDATRPHTV